MVLRKYMFSLFLLLPMLLGGMLHGQAPHALIARGDQFLGSGRPDSALVFYRMAQAQCLESLPLDSNYSQSSCAMALSMYYLGQTGQAQDVLEEAHQNLSEQSGTPDSLIFPILGLLGPICDVNGDIEAALTYALRNLELRSEEQDFGDYANGLNNVGAIYHAKNDFVNAEIYYQAALRSLAKIAPPNRPEDRLEIELTKANTQVNAGLVLLRLGRELEAEGILRQAYGRSRGEKGFEEVFESASTNLGLALVEQGKKEGLDILESLLTPNSASHPNYPQFLGNFGYALSRTASGPDSLAQIRRGLDHLLEAIDRGVETQSSARKALLYLFAAQARKQLPEPETELPGLARLIDKGLEEVMASAALPIDSLGSPAMVAVPDKRTLIRLLALRATDSDRAIEDWRAVFQATDLLRGSMVLEDAKGYFANYFATVNAAALASFWELYGDQKAPYSRLDIAAFGFEVMERNKALILLESLERQQLSASDSIGTLIAAERQLRRDRDYFRQQLNFARQKQDSSAILRHEAYLLERQQQLDRLVAQLDSLQPIRSLSRQRLVRSLDSVQAWAATAGVQVIGLMSPVPAAGTSSGGMYHLDGTNIDFFPLVQDPTLPELLEMFSDWQRVLRGSPEDLQRFKELAHALYRETLGQIFPDSLPPRLVLIPDGLFSFLPFEALLSELPGPDQGYAALPYVLRQSEISYAYSTAFLLRKKHLQKNMRSECLAYAPSYPGASSQRSAAQLRSLEGALPGAQAEVQALSEHIPGEFRFGASATKSDFLNSAGQFQVLHLAMHGVMDPQRSLNSHLVFHAADTTSDHRLYSYEIARMELAAQMVVLSACETGLGRYVGGEGVMSLARGFLAAGTESVIMSLWKLEDGASADLMSWFYAGLAKGERKSEALRNAKLQYLNQADDLSAHPAFWAGYVQVGAADPLDLGGKGDSDWVLWVLALGLSALIWKTVRSGAG